LNAIAILVGSKTPGDYEIAEKSIRSLGRMDLHSALHAVASLDLAEDEFVYDAVAKYLDANLAEYRIYCSWLLRERYGERAAQYLMRLLLDYEMRVHRYTFSLFERRLIEEELINNIVKELGHTTDERPWHLVYLLKLLGKRSRFLSEESVKSQGTQIISVLKIYCAHPRASLRLEAYRALLEYKDLIDLQILLEAAQQDTDVYVRSLVKVVAESK